MKKIILFILILSLNFKYIFSCQYNNPNDDSQNFDLSSLKLDPTNFYKAYVPKTEGVVAAYYIYFNMCGGTVNSCGTNITACQSFNETYTLEEVYPLGSINIPEEYEFNNNGLTLIYTSPTLTPDLGNCSANNNQRKGYFKFSCNMAIDTLSVIGNSSETSTCNYEINIQSKLVCKTCLPTCSGIHRSCDPTSGMGCQCDSQTTGLDCLVSKIVVNSVDSTYQDGGTTFLYGYFGDTYSNRLLIQIGQLNCNDIIVYNQTTVSCKIGPGIGYQNVTVNDRDLSFNGHNLFFYVPKQCPNNCTSQFNGNCNTTSGECECTSQASGLECLVSNIVVNGVDSTYEEGGTTFLHGFFGDTNSTRLSIKIGSLNCTDTIVYNQTTISCNIGPGIGYQNVIVNDQLTLLSFNGTNLFLYLPKQKECPNNCTSSLNGNCNTNTGNCECLGNFIGFDCDSILNKNEPSSKTTINETTGDSFISNEETIYQISIFSLAEISFSGSIVNEFYLTDKWNVTSKSSTLNTPSVTFSQFIQDVNATIEYTIQEVISNNKDYSFAGVDFTLLPGSLKLSVIIRGYNYSSNLNTIQLRIKSTIDQTLTNDTTNCNSKTLNIDTNEFNNKQQSNYLKISKDSKTFYGRFINRIISDGINTAMTMSIINTNSLFVLIGINIPHCNVCEFDPDFSLLVSNSYKSTCNTDNKPSWILPVAVIIPCLFLVGVIIVGAILFRKHRTKILIAKGSFKFSLKKLSKKHKESLYMPN